MKHIDDEIVNAIGTLKLLKYSLKRYYHPRLNRITPFISIVTSQQHDLTPKLILWRQRRHTSARGTSIFKRLRARTILIKKMKTSFVTECIKSTTDGQSIYFFKRSDLGQFVLWPFHGIFFRHALTDFRLYLLFLDYYNI